MPKCSDCATEKPDATTRSLGEYGWACLCNECAKAAIDYIVADLVGPND